MYRNVDGQTQLDRSLVRQKDSWLLGWLERHSNNNKVTEVNGWLVDYFKQIFRLTATDGWLDKWIDIWLNKLIEKDRCLVGWRYRYFYVQVVGWLVRPTDEGMAVQIAG